LDEFVNRFEAEGPGVVEEDMDKGLKLMEMYAVEFEKLEATRIEMGKSLETHTNTFIVAISVTKTGCFFFFGILSLSSHTLDATIFMFNDVFASL
jgi:hypothetical protein